MAVRVDSLSRGEDPSGSGCRPRWLNLALEIPLSGQYLEDGRLLKGVYTPDQLMKCSSGLVHGNPGSYRFHSTHQILFKAFIPGDGHWLPDPSQVETSWGNLYALLLTLKGRLENATANYDHLAHAHEELLGEPILRPLIINYLLGFGFNATESMVLSTELTFKTLYALMRPDADLNTYTDHIRHRPLHAWQLLEDYHEGITDTLNAMPLFNGDDPRRQSISAEDIGATLKLSGDAYWHARYGMTKHPPSQTPPPIGNPPVIQVAWAVYLLSLTLLHRRTVDQPD